MGERISASCLNPRPKVYLKSAGVIYYEAPCGYKVISKAFYFYLTKTIFFKNRLFPELITSR